MPVTRPLVVVALLLSATAGCTSRTAGPSVRVLPLPQSSALATPSVAPTNVLKSRIDAAIAAYRSLWQAYGVAVHHPDPTDADIRKYASGDALNVFVAGLGSMKTQGLAGKGSVVLHPKVVDIEPASGPNLVGISDCVDTTDSYLYKLDGSSYHDTKGGRRSLSATLRFDAGAWKVTEFGLQAVGTC